MNRTLVVGIILFIPVLVMALLGPQLAPRDRLYRQALRFEETPNGTIIDGPPAAPSQEYPLGTDKSGRDILSMLLHGAKWTVGITLFLAAFKVLLGAWLGIRRVFLPKVKPLRANPLSSLPHIVFLFLVLGSISLNFPFNEMILVSVFAFIMLLFGTPATIAAFEIHGRELSQREFYVAAQASGAGRFYLIRHHMLPFLYERFLTIFLGEMINILNTLGQMGIFGIFLGATVKTFDPLVLNSRLYEWAGLVGQARFYIYNYQWILLFPLAAYLLFLFSLYLIQEGLKKHFRRNYRL